MITPLGTLSIGAICPPLLANLQVVIPELTGKLAGLMKVSAALTIKPPSLTANIAAAAKVAAKLALTIDGPTATLQVGVIASMVAQLQLQLTVLQAQIGLLTTSGIGLGV